MAFPAEILAAGVAIADSLTKGVQSTIILERFLSSDASGNETYDTPREVKATVDYTNKVYIRNGQIVSVSATLTITEQLGFTIGNRDKITLPDGSSGPVQSSPGAVNNPLTGTGFIQEVEIGPRG